MPEGAQDARSHDILEAYGRGELPAGVALMRLAMAQDDPAVLARVLDEFGAGHPACSAPLQALQRLAEAHPDAWRTVRAVLGDVSHDPASGTDIEATLARCAAAFDRAAARSPEASVALYSLGSPALLEAATDEVVARMRRWGLIGPDRVLLDLGCGIGRFEAALAGQVRQIVGLDISAAMVDIAHRRCDGFRNVEIRLSSGQDLVGIEDGSVDCLFAVDSFPYIVQAGAPLVEAHFREAARVLKPQGALLILNYSYRGDTAADGADIARMTAPDFLPVRMAEHPFQAWDGCVFHLTKRS